jgi:isopentenyl phosphate kinase
MSELVFVKLGGSTITDKMTPETPRHHAIARIAGELAAAREERPGLRLVLGHGSGSFGHVLARRHQTRAGVHGPDQWRGFAEVAAMAARLNRIVADALLAAGLPVWSLQPSASARCRGGSLVAMDTGRLERALAEGLVPLVYGDVALDDLQGGTIISTEQILVYLARHLRPARLLLATDVDGVLERDLDNGLWERTIPHVSAANWEVVRESLSGSQAPDVTGGMLAKVREVLDLTRDVPGLEAHIFSGEVPGRLKQVILDPAASVPGTRIRWQGAGGT